MSIHSTGSPDPEDPRPTADETVSSDAPLGDDPRPGNVGHAAEAPMTENHEDLLDQASDESFPASDPPSWSAAPTLGEERPDPAVPTGQHGLGHVVEDQSEAAPE